MNKFGEKPPIAPGDLTYEVAQRAERIYVREGNITASLRQALEEAGAKIVKDECNA